MNRLPDADYINELIDERWGNDIPWREMHAKHSPPPVPSALAEDDLTKARRRRVLNECLDDIPQTFRRWQRTA